MQPKHTLFKYLLVLFVLFLAWRISVCISAKYSIGTWFFSLTGILSAMLLAEIIKLFDDRPLFWNTLSAKDKLIVFIDFSLLLIFGLLPVSLGFSFIFVVIFTAFGYGIAWLFTKIFGSDELRKKIF